MAITGDHAPNVAGSVIMLASLALISYGLRVFCRITRGSWSVEDWIMTVALIPFCVLVAGCLGGAFNGIGIHVDRLQQPGNERYQAEGQKFFLIFEVGYCAAIIPIKLSISWMLIRVAEGRKIYIYIQYATIAVFTLMNVIALIFILINCIPIEYVDPYKAAWDPTLLEKGGHCQPAHVLTDVYYACTAVNIVTDWITALMPVPLLWNVQLDRSSKGAVIGLMSLGIFASLSACVRLKYTINLTNQTDFLFAVADVVIWGFAENAIGMIVGNVATLRPLFRSFFDSTLRRAGYTSRSRPSRLASGYELSQHGGKSGDHPATGYLATVTEVQGNHGRNGERSSDELSDGDSQKRIFDGVGMGMGHGVNGAGANHGGVMVSRQVDITYGR
ncbi:hypothetical protein BJY04DRAFT_217500 [Aspergillus karnatakaensis]|uniref:uncharacterized protein n=1 Tax=Aspergillus karnatakaensis TaxID=1810916 RepID=UPI003CCE3374